MTYVLTDDMQTQLGEYPTWEAALLEAERRCGCHLEWSIPPFDGLRLLVEPERAPLPHGRITRFHVIDTEIDDALPPIDLEDWNDPSMDVYDDM